MIRLVADSKRHIMLVMIITVLAMRFVMPSGWMPVSDGGRMMVMMCSGTGAVTAWVDAEGKIHKSDQHDDSGEGDGLCAFAAVNTVLDIQKMAALEGVAPDFEVSVAQRFVAIGHGLAAPPPPSTGPPALI